MKTIIRRKLTNIAFASIIALGCAGVATSTAIVDTVANPSIAHANQWQYSNGGWWLQTNNGYATGWKQINDTWYYFDRNGWMKTGWQWIGGKWYYFNNSGAMLTNTWKDNYYLNDDGSMAINQWIGEYWVGADGKWKPSPSVVTNEAWNQFPKSFSFSSGMGGWATTLYIEKDGSFVGYFYDSDMGTTGMAYPKGTRYESHFIGEFTDPVKINDYEYSMQLKYLEITDTPGEKIVDGIRIVPITDSIDCLGAPTDQPTGNFTLHLPGQKVSEFSERAVLWFDIHDQSLDRTDFFVIVNSSRPDNDAALISREMGWRQSGNDWYYLDNFGWLKTGWQLIDSKWYYFSLDASDYGNMKTGWQYINNNWYYFNKSGVMQTGWFKVGPNWYYSNTSGAMQANRWIGNYWVGSSGAMATNTMVDNSRYYVNQNGLWVA